MIGWIRRRIQAAVVPVHKRCNQGVGCVNRAVVIETPMDAAVGARDVRRCLDHPPADAPTARCQHCGRGYWPDWAHFDCPPGDEPAEDVGIGCQRATSEVEDP